MNQRQRLLGPVVIALSVTLIFVAVAMQRKPADRPAETKITEEKSEDEPRMIVLRDVPTFLARSKSIVMVKERRWWGLKILSYGLPETAPARVLEPVPSNE